MKRRTGRHQAFPFRRYHGSDFMNSLRLAPLEDSASMNPCGRCGAGQRPWDLIAGQSFCPHCLEALAVGEGDPLITRSEKKRCAVCHQQGTVPFVTFPLHSPRPVEIDMCGEHLRALIGRRLGPHAFAQLRRQLHALGLEVAHIFLLHEAFYDSHGRALQPAVDVG
jgi:hypothetical protein